MSDVYLLNLYQLVATYTDDSEVFNKIVQAIVTLSERVRLVEIRVEALENASRTRTRDGRSLPIFFKGERRDEE